MKLSISIAVLILVLGASMGWRDHRLLGAARAANSALVAEASMCGIVTDAAASGGAVRLTKRERENREEVAKRFAVDLIAFAKGMEALEGKPDSRPDEKRIMELMDRMMSLDSAQLKILIGEIGASTDLKEETRQGLVGFAMMTLAKGHPQMALGLFKESAGLFKDSGMGKHVVATSLASWAKEDPLGAIEWARTNGSASPELVSEQAKRGILAGAAEKDPQLAFKLIGELGLKDDRGSVRTILSVAKTPEERTGALSALREHMATCADEKARDEAIKAGVEVLVGASLRDGYESASQWIAGANLTEQELAGVTGSLNVSQIKSSETGQWIEWLGSNIPTEKGRDCMKDMVRQWTENDYQAAGTWLSATPDGPQKHIAIRSYAETIARYEPSTAAQWAMTLPTGKERDATLRTIYRNWPKNDAAAAADFAKQHGIK